MTPIKFIVEATPVGQPRPRATMAHGGRHARIHEVTDIGKGFDRKPHPIVQFRHSVRQSGLVAFAGMQPFAGPTEVQIVLLFARPGRLRWKTRPMPRIPFTSAPDADNCAKAVTDSLIDVAYVDDSQVTRLVVEKWYAAGDERPHVEVLIRELPLTPPAPINPL